MSDLEQEFPGKLVANNVDATTPDAERAVRELGFGNHGLVIRSAGGETLWKQPDHDVRIEDVRQALQELLAAR